MGIRLLIQDKDPVPGGILAEWQILNGPYRSISVTGKARQRANSTHICHQKPDPVSTSQLPESSIDNHYGNHFTDE